MCRVFGCVSAEPVSIRHELLEAENPMIRQSEEHDSGWGMAVYSGTDGADPELMRFPQAAFADAEFLAATDPRGRIFNVHVRRATMGGLSLENTHPFVLGNYSYCHNGTIIRYPRLLEPGMRRPRGDTDSEHFFNFLMRDYDPGDPVELAPARRDRTTVERSPFSGLNFLFSDGERLYAYRLGIFELHWRAEAGPLLVASECVTDEPWHSVQQDVLLVLDPDDVEEPHAERLVGDERGGARANIQKLDRGAHLRGAERGAMAAERAARSRSRGRRVSRRFALLVNPASAGGGRSGPCPSVIATLDALGAQHRTVTTRSVEHAREEAARAAEQGETVAALGGDGLLRPLAGALKGTGHRPRADPLRARQRPGARARRAQGPCGGRADRRRGAASDCSTWPSVDGTPFLGIASFGFDTDANRIANEARFVKGDAVYAYAALRALIAWKPARFRVTVDGERHELTGYSVAVGNSGAYGGGMYLLPHALLDDGELDVLMSEDSLEADVPARACRRCSRARTSTRRTRTCSAGRVIEVSSDRPFVIYADGDPIGTTPATVTVEPRCLRVIVPRPALMYRLARALARLVRAVSRRLGRSGGTTAPGRLLLRSRPARCGGWPRGSTRDRCSCRPRTARPPRRRCWPPRSSAPGAPVVHNRAGSNMTWGVATALLDAGRAPGQIGLFEVDEAWLPDRGARSPPAPAAAGQPLPRPARPLRRARVAGRPLGRARGGADAPPALVLNADDPLVADLGRDRDGVTYFGVEDDSQALPELQHAADSKHCRNCGTAYHYDAIYLGHLGRYRCPGCGRERPRPAGGGHPRRARGHVGLAHRAAHARGRAVAAPARARPLQRLQRGGRHRHGARARRAARHAGEALESFGGAFGRVETIPFAGASCRSC